MKRMISTTGHYEPIAREGLVFGIPLVLLSGATWWYGAQWVSLVCLVAAVAVSLFFRNPERTPPEGENLVLSPADGRVMEIVRDAHSERLDSSPLTRISIFMSIFNTHVNRWPTSGIVKEITHVPGKFLDARNSEASLVNEHNSLVVQGKYGTIEVVQIAGKIARRIACWVSRGDTARRGDRFGLIRFGSRLDVYLPGSPTPAVKIGDTVRAGVSVLCEYPEQKRV